uniref:p53 DNA-binding domain-containing protein n=1 Tax=Timema douglasi TaxID=61478 RepID=A0A7R8VFM6_TIMDO|nr:unnamed protein product [Timema douglasi]
MDQWLKTGSVRKRKLTETPNEEPCTSFDTDWTNNMTPQQKTEERKKMSPLCIGLFPHFASFPSGTVVGRSSLNVRVCSCPKRDSAKEEKDLAKAAERGDPSQSSCKRVTDSNTTRLSLKRKKESDTTLLMCLTKDAKMFAAMMHSYYKFRDDSQSELKRSVVMRLANIITLPTPPVLPLRPMGMSPESGRSSTPASSRGESFHQLTPVIPLAQPELQPSPVHQQFTLLASGEEPPSVGAPDSQEPSSVHRTSPPFPRLLEGRVIFEIGSPHLCTLMLECDIVKLGIPLVPFTHLRYPSPETAAPFQTSV